MLRLPHFARNADVLRPPAFEEAWYGGDVPPARIETLYANRLLHGYPRRVLDECLPALRYVRLPANVVVTDERQVPRRMYLLLEGRVALQMQRGPNAPIIDILHSGDFFGEASVLDLGRHSHVTRCLETSALCSIDAADVVRCLRPSSVLALTIARALHRRLQSSLARLEGARMPAESALSDVLRRSAVSAHHRRNFGR